MLSQVPAAMIAAYHATNFRVDIGGSAYLTLRIGHYDAVLDKLHRERGVTTSVVITAWNPVSEETADAVNCAAQDRLLAAIGALDLVSLPASGADPAGKWAEPSLFVFGMRRDVALDLGRQFRQNAVVFCGREAIPSLLLCR